MLFNIYYLNFSKVYEIKMMLSNVIKTDETIETNQGDTIDAELQPSFTAIADIFNTAPLENKALETRIVLRKHS